MALLGASAAFAASYVVPPDDVLVGKAEGIVIARAATSWVEETERGGIETVTEFTVEDVLKGGGSFPASFRVRLPGGAIENRVKIVPGAPRFVNGDRVLLFVNSHADGRDYTTTDLGLGQFGFAYDDLGRQVIIRAEGEIFGWDLKTNQPHQEPRRSAEPFLDYIRAVASGRPDAPNYIIDRRPIVDKSASIQATTDPVTALGCTPPACTATSYTISLGPLENALGFRWRSFPAAVNFNQGSTEPGAASGGTAAINTAFSSWDGDTQSNVTYVLASSTSNTNGIREAADGVNNIVFEKDISGQAAYVCTSGGLLGIGGVQAAYTGACGQNQDPNTCAHLLNGETFATSAEADVSMNRGIANCSTLFTSGNFDSAVTHEVGHTLGFRHADQNRLGNDVCATDASLQCSSSAIMTSTVTPSLHGALQAFDQNAVRTVYPAGSAPVVPTGVDAQATSATAVLVAWTAVPDATSYEVYRSANNSTYSLVGSPAGSSFTDATAVANTAYLYRVRAVNSGGSSADSANDLATTVIFTDDPLVASTTAVKAIHLTELRTAMTAVRALAGLGAAPVTDVSPAGIAIKAVHITELRTALDGAMTVLGKTTGGFTNTLTAGVTPIKALDVQEIRTRVK